ncbi:MAG: hypothetical protein KDI36_02365 [Pseudomonadales bacterium]|nr:hypothetical protein [Pseudomonadales bacterium]
MKIGAIQPQLPANRQQDRYPRQGAEQPETVAGAGERATQGYSFQRPASSEVQRAIDFYIITEAISRPGYGEQYTRIDTFA